MGTTFGVTVKAKATGVFPACPNARPTRFSDPATSAHAQVKPRIGQQDVTTPVVPPHLRGRGPTGKRTSLAVRSTGSMLVMSEAPLGVSAVLPYIVRKTQEAKGGEGYALVEKRRHFLILAAIF